MKLYCVKSPSRYAIDPAVYRDKVLGCWTGKNIGGTFGAPFEFTKEMNDASFYTRELNGKPLPNDDLDLQLVWLLAAEEQGVYRLNEKLLGEYWLRAITGPWNEYGVCKMNLRNGLIPPLSGSCNNERWKNSNGAWIRSEVWACLFPGSPDEAVQFAWYDSCCDHAAEGIYAELFTAAMEAAAFVVNDIRNVVEIGLSKIPDDCRLARSIRMVCESYDKGTDFREVREALVRLDADIGMFQAPANLGFVVIGLLYGEGDFGRSLTFAVNCGDDADCTAGTVGALLGILHGRRNIPQKWAAPIGESIRTCSISLPPPLIPETVGELTDRVVRLARLVQQENPSLPAFRDGAEEYPALEELNDREFVQKRIWNRSSHCASFDFSFGRLYVEYEGGPIVTPGAAKKLKLGFGDINLEETTVEIRLLLPEGWSASPSAEFRFLVQRPHIPTIGLEVVPGEFTGAFRYIPVEVRVAPTLYPQITFIPFQKAGAVESNLNGESQEYYARASRRHCRLRVLFS